MPTSSSIWNLRELAESKRIQVFGTLWLMERLFDVGLISIDEMENAYEIMLNAQRRLPVREIERQLAKLRAAKGRE